MRRKGERKSLGGGERKREKEEEKERGRVRARETRSRKVCHQRPWWLPSMGKRREEREEERKNKVVWATWQAINGQFKTFPELKICTKLFKFLIWPPKVKIFSL